MVETMATSPRVVEAEPHKKKRMRSPAYPFINLETAIKRAKEFYDREGRNAAPLKVAVRHWGYEEKSSGGLQTAAALMSFGLMQDEGTGDNRKLRLTPSALTILLDDIPGSEARADAIRDAALTPKIHQQLWNKWRNNIPSDPTVRHMLVLELKPPFNPSVAPSVIKEYRDTIAFAKPEESAMVPLGGGDLEAELENELDDADSGVINRGRMRVRDHAFQPGNQSATIMAPVGSRPVGSSIPVTEDCVMSITASGEVTQKGIAQLIAYLNLIKSSFPN
jgi:hypothetical protein